MNRSLACTSSAAYTIDEGVTVLTMDERMLPGDELIRAGLDDLARGVESPEALLVAIGAPRLRRLGVPVPDHPFTSPELRLYRYLARPNSDAAHARYNALIRRLVSFERAAECAR